MITPPEPAFLRARNQVAFIGVQLLPLLLLAPVFLIVSPAIAVTRVDGVPLKELLVASAVLGPLLTQTVSGPIFSTLDKIAAGDACGVSLATLRSMPTAILISLPVVALVAVGVSFALHDGVMGAIAFAGLLEANMLFAASLVPAFSLRSTRLLALAWAAYAAALLLAPSLWWAPAILGFVSQIIPALIRSGVRRTAVYPTGLATMMRGAVRGIAAALPLWALPIALYLQNPDRFGSELVFVALVPALIAYHVYFSTVAVPIWRSLDGVRSALATLPYHEAETTVSRVGRQARLGEWRVVVIVVVSVVLSLPFSALVWPDQNELVIALIGSSGLSVILMTQVCRLGMLRNAVSTYVVAAILAITLVVSSTVIARPVPMLLVDALVCLACSLVVSASNRTVWKRPEHALFWRSALGQ